MLVRSLFPAPSSFNIFALRLYHKHQRLGKTVINTNDVAISGGLIDPIFILFSCDAMDRSVSVFRPHFARSVLSGIVRTIEWNCYDNRRQVLLQVSCA